jgi:hypothetical protein
MKDGMKRENKLEKHPFVVEPLNALCQRVFLTVIKLGLQLLQHLNTNENTDFKPETVG